MTSMPASRRARAMIFAPRSWPSRPGLATTTRIFRAVVLMWRAQDGTCALAAVSGRLPDVERHAHPGVDGADDAVAAPGVRGRAVRALGLGRRVEPARAAGDRDVVRGRAGPLPDDRGAALDGDRAGAEEVVADLDGARGAEGGD